MSNMLSELTEFHDNEYQNVIKQNFIDPKRNTRKPYFSFEKVAYITFFYHKSHYKSFKCFYLEDICKKYKHILSKLPSYSWMLRLKNRCLHFISCFFHSKFSKNHDICFVDSIPISESTLTKFAKNLQLEAKSSVGWFYGFKVHAIINHEGKIVRTFLSKAILDDRKGLKAMVQGFAIIGDKGYLSKKLRSELAEKDINLITNYKENMKNKPNHSDFELKLLQKRKT